MKQKLRKYYRQFYKSEQKHPLFSVLLKYLPEEKPLVIIDIGAHKGHFFDIIRSCRDIEKAVLVEPIPSLARGLESKYKNINVRVFPNIISNKNAPETFYVNEFPATSSLMPMSPALQDFSSAKSEKVTVEAMTLDELGAKAGLSGIDLLKIDVQGAELLVLSKGEQVLKGTDRIWIEVSFRQLYEGSATFFDIYNYLDQQGFTLNELSPGYRSKSNELLQADALFSRNR